MLLWIMRIGANLCKFYGLSLCRYTILTTILWLPFLFNCFCNEQKMLCTVELNMNWLYHFCSFFLNWFSGSSKAWEQNCMTREVHMLRTSSGVICEFASISTILPMRYTCVTPSKSWMHCSSPLLCTCKA